MKCELKDIENKMFITVSEGTEKVIRGLEQSGIRYFVQISDKKAMFAYSAEDSNRISEIISRSENDEAVCRYISHDKSDSRDDYPELLPEIAEIMEISISKLQSVPVDIQNRITNTYVNYCYADKFTIRQQLDRIISLNSDVQQTPRESHKKQGNHSISER